MNTEQDIERALRHAPRPEPPAGLKQKLVDEVRLPAPAVRRNSVPEEGVAAWLKRWWPALVPAAASAACGLVLTLQQTELDVLEAGVKNLPATSAEPVPGADPIALSPAAQAADSLSPEEELAKLRETQETLTAEVKALESLKAENQKLRARMAQTLDGALAPEELKALQEAKEKASAIQCVNNLKQLGLAMRIYANDNGDITPPDLLAMTNHMGTPKILVCAGDTGREAAKDWSSFSDANLSYKYLLPACSLDEPQAVVFMCPFHGSICLQDGSVQMGVGKRNPEALQQREGKLYYSPRATPESNAAPAGGGQKGVRQ